MDNASGHNASATDDRLDIDWLPPNTTARFQPCDQGVINATETTYRRGMMLDLLRCRWGALDVGHTTLCTERDFALVG